MNGPQTREVILRSSFKIKLGYFEMYKKQKNVHIKLGFLSQQSSLRLLETKKNHFRASWFDCDLNQPRFIIINNKQTKVFIDEFTQVCCFNLKITSNDKDLHFMC